MQDLDGEMQRTVAMQSQPVRVSAGHSICTQGSPADSLWILQEGKCSACMHTLLSPLLTSIT